MNKAGIRSITRKKFRPQGSKDRVMERPNLLQQDFKTTSINEKWVADITYIHILRDDSYETFYRYSIAHNINR
ncbi:hypothetical protein DZB91_14595 [Brevibacillus sp. VP]|nr:hypothetical protein DZB91_14595 [Brevibacillus sp. VP]